MAIETSFLRTVGLVSAPFAKTEVQLRPKQFGAIWIWMGVVMVFLGIGGTVGVLFLSSHFLNNKYRTLELFSIPKYLTSYKGLSGSKYRATLKVENDLAWNEGAGRLMLFSTSDDPRPFAAVVSPNIFEGIYFTKGQIYTAELEVKEGGLIYVNSCQKD